MEIYGKTAVFPGGLAGLGKYCMGGYGWIRVYRVNPHVRLGISLQTSLWAINPACLLPTTATS